MTTEEAYKIVLEDLENRNSHTVGKLLEWDYTGQEDEILYRAWLLARNYIQEKD